MFDKLIGIEHLGWSWDPLDDPVGRFLSRSVNVRLDQFYKFLGYGR